MGKEQTLLIDIWMFLKFEGVDTWTDIASLTSCSKNIRTRHSSYNGYVLYEVVHSQSRLRNLSGLESKNMSSIPSAWDRLGFSLTINPRRLQATIAGLIINVEQGTLALLMVGYNHKRMRRAFFEFVLAPTPRLQGLGTRAMYGCPEVDFYDHGVGLDVTELQLEGRPNCPPTP